GNTATLTNSGLVILVNGTTGAEISRIEGINENSYLSGEFVFEHPTENFLVISDSGANVDGLLGAGQIILMPFK
ncbi:hypothetical protein N9D31_01585, partial [Oligoflexaceae bacterium]|nr:hypothetical protein [Oligoflexaceae bacterium]